jgi:hypothetical protein
LFFCVGAEEFNVEKVIGGKRSEKFKDFNFFVMDENLIDKVEEISSDFRIKPEVGLIRSL